MKRIFLAAVLALGIFVAKGETIRVSPGTLSDLLGESGITTTSLTLSGEADARDLSYLASLPALKTLDMSALNIVALQNATPVIMNRRHYDADALPAFVFSLSKIEKVVLPASLTHIEECAFASSAIKEVGFGPALKSIDSWAFYHSALADIFLPGSVVSLGEGVFADCRNLANANLSAAQLKSLPQKSFRGCTALKSILFPGGLTSLGAESLLGSGLESIVLTANITQIGEYALSQMPQLAGYSAANPQLGNGALFGNGALTSVSGQTTFGTLSLAATPALLLDSVTSTAFTAIGDYALAGNATGKLHISSKLGHVGEHALEGMSNLTVISALAAAGNVPDAVTDAFNGLDNPKAIELAVDKDYLEAWSDHPEWSRFNIKGYEVTGVAAIENDNSDIVCSIEENILVVRSVHQLTAITVCSADGMMIGAGSPMNTEWRLDLANVDCTVIVVRAVSSRSAANFKLRR